MDSFEFNKVAMAVLGTVFAVFGVSILSEAIFHSSEPAEPAYILAEVEDPAAGADAEQAGPAYDPVAPLLASADVAAGEAVFKKCISCHTIEPGGPNKVGPNLHDIVGADIAADEAFSYSTALQTFGADNEWTYENLNGFLWKPKAFVRGTAMGFVGLSDVEDRANVIAYLRANTENPPPLPEPEAEVAADAEQDGAGATQGDAGTAPAEEDAAPEEENPEAQDGNGENGG